MTANSLLQLSRIDKENVKRKDLIVVSPEMLEVEEGFNVRGVNLSQEEYWSEEDDIKILNILGVDTK